MSETLQEKIKRLHEENQTFFDKALFALSIAMFPILMQFYDKLHFENDWIFWLYICCFILLSLTLLSFLIGFLMAKNGCDKQDTLLNDTSKTGSESKIEKQKNFFYKYANIFEIISIVCITLFFVCTIRMIVKNKFGGISKIIMTILFKFNILLSQYESLSRQKLILRCFIKSAKPFKSLSF